MQNYESTRLLEKMQISVGLSCTNNLNTQWSNKNYATKFLSWSDMTSSIFNIDWFSKFFYWYNNKFTIKWLHKIPSHQNYTIYNYYTYNSWLSFALGPTSSISTQSPNPLRLSLVNTRSEMRAARLNNWLSYVLYGSRIYAPARISWKLSPMSLSCFSYLSSLNAELVTLLCFSTW